MFSKKNGKAFCLVHEPEKMKVEEILQLTQMKDALEWLGTTW